MLFYVFFSSYFVCPIDQTNGVMNPRSGLRKSRIVRDPLWEQQTILSPDIFFYLALRISRRLRKTKF